jgi:hypothetical protein
MARASKGKVKHLWKLYGVWHLVALHNSMIWFFEPSPEMRAISEAWLVKNMHPQPFVKEVATKGYYDGCRKIDWEVDNLVQVSMGEVTDHERYAEIKSGRHRFGEPTVMSWGNGLLTCETTAPDGTKIVAVDFEANLL